MLMLKMFARCFAAGFALLNVEARAQIVFVPSIPAVQPGPASVCEEERDETMKHRLGFIWLLLAMSLALAPTALASTKWYVNGVNGSDNNDCKSRQHACKTIGHAISLASSGDSVLVAPATYTENLTINIGLKLIGSGVQTTIIDGGQVGTVVTLSRSATNVILSKFTVRNGSARGISTTGTLTINKSTISGNSASPFRYCMTGGGGIWNGGTLTINNSTVSNNTTHQVCGGSILNYLGTVVISNSTVSGNAAGSGGGIFNPCCYGVYLQKTIVANSLSGGNCFGTITSNGYNLSSDSTCNFNGSGDLNNTRPQARTVGELRRTHTDYRSALWEPGDRRGQPEWLHRWSGSFAEARSTRQAAVRQGGTLAAAIGERMNVRRTSLQH
jgi:hypothetical protein